MTQISILGCGWLGLPLAKQLIEKGHSVNGSTTSENKLSIFKELGINPFLATLESESISESITEFLKKSQILIIDIPPKLRGNSPDPEKKVFVEKIKNLIPFVEKSTIEKVLFVNADLF